MKRTPSGLTRPLIRLKAMAKESNQEARGPAPLVLIVAGALIFAWIGHILPSPMGSEGSLAGAFFSGGTQFVLALLAISTGAWALAADRGSGLADALFSKPLAGAQYYLGRLIGLAARLTLIAAAAWIAAGCFLALFPGESEFSMTSTPFRFTKGGKELSVNSSVLLFAKGGKACWDFSSPPEGRNPEGMVRFGFRPRFSRNKPFSDSIPVGLTVRQGDALLLDREVIVKNRKSLSLPIDLAGNSDVRVALSVKSGHNLMELSGNGCTLVHGKTGPMLTLLLATLSFLPAVYLSLAAALTFSAFVSAPTAFFSTAVLGLLVLMGPSVQADLRLAASGRNMLPVDLPGHAHHAPQAHDHPTEESRFFRSAAEITADALSILPDPGAGGSVEPLTRMECPGKDAVTRPWKESIAAFLGAVFLGCMLAGRRQR